MKPIEEAPNPPPDDITEDPEDPNPGPTCYSIKTEVVSLSLPVLCEVSARSLTIPVDIKIPSIFFLHYVYHLLHLFVFQIQEPMIFQVS